MKKNYLFLPICPLLFTIVFLISCNGQSNPNVLENNQPELKIPLRNDTPIADFIVEIFEDSKGNLWFGTMAKGAARYDGKTLTYFTQNEGLAGNAVASITEDQQGNIWFGTQSGLSKYDGVMFTNFTKKEGLCHEQVSKLFFDKKGKLWIGTWGGICHYNGLAFSDFPLPAPDIEVPSYQATTEWVTQIMEGKDGNIWIGRSGYGACKYDGKTFTHFTKKDGLPSNCVQAIQEDKQGNLWFGTRVAEKDHPDEDKRTGPGGLCFYDGQNFVSFSEPEGLSENDIYTISVDKSGAVWIGATGVGVYKYDGKDFTIYQETNRMDLTTGLGLQGVLEDRNGGIWLGFSGGLFRLEEASIIHVGQEGPWK